MFRGDYVILSYEINDLKISQFPELDKVKDSLWDYEKIQEYRHRQVYVALKEANGIYIAESAGFQKPEHKLYLKGKISYIFNKLPPQPVSEPPNQVSEPPKPVKEPMKNVPDTIKVEYELDKFFVPENTGLKLEELSRQGQLIATIKIYNGYAQLVKVEKAQ